MMTLLEVAEKLKQTDIPTISKKTNVSEIILRRIRDGKESNIRESTLLKLSLVLKQL